MNATRELTIFKEMITELESFLLAEALFWTIRPGSDFPQLSLGLLLLTRARLRALAPQLTGTQTVEYQRTETQLDLILSRWAVAAETKASRELHTRLNLWQAYLSDVAESPRANAEDYAQEVTHRTIASLLRSHFSRLADSPEIRRLAGTDAQLRALFKPGDFVWAAELQSQFPKSDFWFLYGRV